MSEVVGVDTGCLVAAAVAEHPAHQQTRAKWLALTQQGSKLGLTPLVLAEFAHVVTDGRRFQQPCDMQTALSLAEAWWNAPESEQVLPTAMSMELSWKWMRQHHLGRKRILDTLLAAMFFEQGVRKVLTINPRDFEVFGIFDILSLDSDPARKD